VTFANATPQWCEIRDRFCTCEPRCVDEEEAAFCHCAKDDLTPSERAAKRCQGCGKPL